MSVIHGVGTYPGIFQIESVEYTLSHGISPGVAVVTFQPQDTPPFPFGDLVITDGVNGIIVIPDCRLDNVQCEMGGAGMVWRAYIQDRRWRWQYGVINGSYNMLDRNGKLIPASIISPIEAAQLCLTAMGESNYTIDLPPGLDTSWRLGLSNQLTLFLPTGINYPPTGTNPPIEWYGRNPAQALQELAETYGRRVVYRLSTNSVAITQLGVGGPLPDGSIYKESPSLKQPESCDSVMVIGNPTCYQTRLLLKPVGIEWDGTYVDINDLSYAPLAHGGQVQINRINLNIPPNLTLLGEVGGYSWRVWIGPPGVNPTLPLQLDVRGITATYVSAANDGPVQVYAGLVGALLNALANANPPPGVITSINPTTDGTQILLTGQIINEPFTVAVSVGVSVPGPPIVDRPPAAGISIFQQLTQEALGNDRIWEDADPPNFAGLRGTNNLTLDQALALAQRSVWKCYQVAGVGLNGSGPIVVPGYGIVTRRQQLVLLDVQVDQIVPTTAIPGLTQLNQNDFNNVVRDLYQGISKDKPARVYGAVTSRALRESGFVWEGKPVNTGIYDEVPLEFDLDPVWQVITFGEYVYYDTSPDGIAGNPNLALQCAVNIRNVATNQLEAFTQAVPVPWGPGTTLNPKVELHPDIQLNITSTYAKAGDTINTYVQNAGNPQSTIVTVTMPDPPRANGLELALVVYVGPAGVDPTQPGQGTPVVYNVIDSDTEEDATAGLFAAMAAGGGTWQNLNLSLPGAGHVNEIQIEAKAIGAGFSIAVNTISSIDPSPATLTIDTTSANPPSVTPGLSLPAPPNWLMSSSILEADPLFRANFYIQGMLLQFQLSGAEIRTYNGIIPIDCDGAIQQVSWRAGGEGCETTASLNCEFHPYVPPYPKRRRAENLAVIDEQSARNRRISWNGHIGPE